MAVDLAGKTTKQLREERAKLITQAQAYNDEHEATWSAEDQAVWDGMMSDAQTLQETATRREKITAMVDPDNHPEHGGQGGGEFAGGQGNQPVVMIRDGSRMPNGAPRYVPLPVGARDSRAYREEFAHYLSTSKRGATLQSDSADRGGYLLVPEQFASEMLREVDDLVHIRRRAKVHTVRFADTLGIRKRNARANTFRFGSELEVADTDTSMRFGKKVLTPHPMTGSVKISRDLARRTAGTVEAEVRGEMARDSGEVQEDNFLFGNGDRCPLGVFVASDDGISTARDFATGSATGFTADGLINAKYGMKSQYRRGQLGELAWLFHRDAIKLIAKLKDKDDQYLFRVGAGFAADNQAPEDMLLGYPVDESERAPNTFTDQNYAGILGNWRYYEIADALDMEMQVLYELNAKTNEIEYIGRLKLDGMPTLDEAFARLKCST